MSRDLHLQVNRSGGWRTALTFDMDGVDVEAIQVAAANLVVLADPAGNTKLRLATADGMQRALIRWDAKGGWQDA
ncbi:hypothetical protein [Acidovorax sp.]|jgi:hypothetical protein|uniref:hypothetical protein n=1 Tax=Acidovorax sp. TaxID=1872122 RepID=UPI00391EF5FB